MNTRGAGLGSQRFLVKKISPVSGYYLTVCPWTIYLTLSLSFLNYKMGFKIPPTVEYFEKKINYMCKGLVSYASFLLSSENILIFSLCPHPLVSLPLFPLSVNMVTTLEIFCAGLFKNSQFP